MKKLIFLATVVCLLAIITYGAMTETLDGRPNARWWTGSPGDSALLWGREVEVILEAWTLADDTSDILTFPVHGATISNATDDALIFVEKSEQFKWVFASTSITASSTTGVVKFDWGAIVPTANQMLFTPVATGAVVGTVEGTIFYDSTNDSFYGRDNDSWVDLGAAAGAPGGSDTEVQYNNGGAFDGISTLVWDDTNIIVTDDANLAFGTGTDWVFKYDESVDNQLLLVTADTNAVAATDPMFEVLVGAAAATDQQVFGVAKGTQSSNTALFTVDAEGDVITAGSLTVGTTFYQASIVAAATSNVALALDGKGNGAVGINQTGTGDITLYRATLIPLTLDVAGNSTFDGTVTLGDNAADNITITGDIVNSIRLDDDTTDSPSLTFLDDGEDNWVFLKVDTAAGNFTATSNVGTSDFHIVTGNLKVGAGAEGVTLNGEDAFITGTFEVNGAVQLDGAVVMNSTCEINGNITLQNDETIKNDADGEIEFSNGTEDASIDFETGDTLSWTTNSSVATVAWGDLDAHTGLDSLAFDAAASTITLAAGGASQDLTMQVTGAHASSLIFQNTGGTSADAISLLCDGAGGGITIDTDNGAISIVADNSTAGDITIDAEDKIIIVSTDADGTDSIYLHANGGTSEVIKIHSDLGDTATSLHLLSDAGGITIDVGADDAITLVPGTAGITCSTGMLVDFILEITTDIDNETLSGSDSGGVFDNNADSDTQIYTLPSAVAGYVFTFCDVESAAGADLCIKAAASDTINGGSAAEYYNCYTDAVGQSVTLVAVSAVEWIIVAEVGTWTNDSNTTE